MSDGLPLPNWTRVAIREKRKEHGLARPTDDGDPRFSIVVGASSGRSRRLPYRPAERPLVRISLSGFVRNPRSVGDESRFSLSAPAAFFDH